MDTHSADNSIPWALIVSALQGDLTSDDRLRLEVWLAQSSANQQQFKRLEQIWREGIADYPRYLEADESRAWSEMQARLDSGPAPGIGRIVRWRWVAAAAAVLLVVAGTEWWRMSRDGMVRYETAAAEVRTMSLADGTTMVLQPRTRVEVAAEFNKGSRKVILLAGKAEFIVAHRQSQPFEVVMEGAGIRDIGTSFTAYTTTDSIGVTVSEGKVAFTDKITGETRELTAGGEVVQLMSAGRRGEIKTNDLRFDNARLSVVIAAVRERYGKTIGLADPAFGEKRLTLHLDRESFDDAVKVICASLNLESQADSNGYILKNHATR
ncbi:MAG TPA: FecR domain-containing protein [Puia sp.]|jgi:transmembrane sensor|nr:FecR domain-containing protein [Puia sp.]